MTGIRPEKDFEKNTADSFADAVAAVIIVAVLFVLAPSEIATAVGAGSVGVSGVRSIASVNDRPGERTYREDILSLTRQGAQKMDAVLERLHLVPRADILTILRDDLSASPVAAPLSSLKAVVLLRAVELVPQLKSLAQRTEDWTIFAHINALVLGEVPLVKDLAAEFVPVYLKRLPALLSPVARVAVIEGLTSFKVAVPDSVFTDFLSATNYDVRIAAVRNFLATQSELQTNERQRRMVLALDVRPMQARLLALQAVPRLPASERTLLRSLFSGDRCARESNRKLQVACKDASLSFSGRRGGR
jgi:hypothetical protein